eukprot:CAMPEP_0194332210 /NCGR_PEP_ID=MMETSP0171-20130528/58387_1 /TAXON_ID=218684 /ORGANISM="Corethron pennatum, Strain L29A3" /LENGTH=118 /DNA_ID=CAMNT_0039093967 /DNA_START=137 /DNA_END=494 /DNA_ORIENTATION=-
MQQKLLLVICNVHVNVPMRQEGRDTFLVSSPHGLAKGDVSELPPDVYHGVPVPIPSGAPVEDVGEGPEAAESDAQTSGALTLSSAEEILVLEREVRSQYRLRERQWLRGSRGRALEIF